MDEERSHSRNTFPRGFTISEVLICVVIILILATLAIAGYSQVLDNAYQRVCATNQTIIMRGIERHFLTTGIAPATLGGINIEHWKAAYAAVMKNRDWQTKLSYFLVRITDPRQACAAITQLEHLVTPAEMKVYGIMADVFRCPADTTPESPSYGINTALPDYDRWSNVSADMDIIADCDSYTFSSEDGLCYRHKAKLGREQIAQATTKSGRGKKHKKDKHKLTKEKPEKEKPEKEKPKKEKPEKEKPGDSNIKDPNEEAPIGAESISGPGDTPDPGNAGGSTYPGSSGGTTYPGSGGTTCPGSSGGTETPGNTGGTTGPGGTDNSSDSGGTENPASSDTDSDEQRNERWKKAREIWNEAFPSSQPLDDTGKNEALNQIKQELSQLEQAYLGISAEIKYAQERIDFWNSQRNTFLGALGRVLYRGKNSYIDGKVKEWETKLNEAKQEESVNRQNMKDLEEAQQILQETDKSIH